MRKLGTLIVHHSASPLSTTLEDIRGWHLGRGWSDIGYHYVIEEDGKIRVGRPLWLTGAHCRRHNSYTVGVCLVGDNTRPGEEWTNAQIKSLKTLANAFNLVLPEMDAVGHRDKTATLCPGLDIKELLKEA
jgi:hypothetical protein